MSSHLHHAWHTTVHFGRAVVWRRLEKVVLFLPGAIVLMADHSSLKIVAFVESAVFVFIVAKLGTVDVGRATAVMPRWPEIVNVESRSWALVFLF